MRHVPILLSLLCLTKTTNAFVPATTSQQHGNIISPLRHVGVAEHYDWQLAVSMAEPPENASFIKTPFMPRKKTAASTGSFMLTPQEAHPLITIGKQDGKQKIINAYGLWCAVVSLVTAPIWFTAMFILNNVVYKINKDFDPNRAIYDKTGKLWCKSWLTMIDSYPTCSGDVERLKEGGIVEGPCLFVANHASWLDIPVICTVLDPVFKFIAKGELVKIPCIGQQLTGGNHILIDREDRRSQLRTFKEGIAWLKKGVPLMAFPEGKRSKDGRLMEFKGGLFSMAVKTQVPIVPITICNAHAIMPSYGLLPVQRGAGKLHVHVHDAIDTQGKTEAELGELVRVAFLSQLPPDQQPLVVSTTPPTIAVVTDSGASVALPSSTTTS